MATALFCARLHSRRDLVRVRQRARQIAGLLGFDSHHQSWIAANVFDIACQACRFTGRAVLRFQLHDSNLQVRVGGSWQRLVHPLPEQPTRLALEDLPWAIQQLDQLTPLCLFEEFRLQNQELLGVLNEAGRDRDSTSPAA